VVILVFQEKNIDCYFSTALRTSTPWAHRTTLSSLTDSRTHIILYIVKPFQTDNQFVTKDLSFHGVLCTGILTDQILVSGNTMECYLHMKTQLCPKLFCYN